MFVIWLMFLYIVVEPLTIKIVPMVDNFESVGVEKVSQFSAMNCIRD